MSEEKNPIVVRRSIFRTAVVVEMLGEEIGANPEDIAEILRDALGRQTDKTAGNYMGQVYSFLFERDMCREAGARIEVKPDDE